MSLVSDVLAVLRRAPGPLTNGEIRERLDGDVQSSTCAVALLSLMEKGAIERVDVPGERYPHYIAAPQSQKTGVAPATADFQHSTTFAASLGPVATPGAATALAADDSAPTVSCPPVDRALSDLLGGHHLRRVLALALRAPDPINDADRDALAACARACI